MSEELIKKGLTKSGLRIGNYEYYVLGETTLNQLKSSKIIPNRSYGAYSSRKPDALLVDRRNKQRIKVLLALEYKDDGKFNGEKDKEKTIQQCNDLCQVLKAEVGIATDGSSYSWLNPNQPNKENEYPDKTTKTVRSYTLITNKEGRDFIDEFVIDQKNDESDLDKTSEKTKMSIQNLELVRRHITKENSKLSVSEHEKIDPTILAKQIWQDVWSVSGATPEKCLYTFVELFIFKYLSDLNILDEDENGVKINFKDIYALDEEKAFKYYHKSVREHLKKMFPENKEDGTTIINGTVLTPNVPEHSIVFYKILKKFDEFGELKNIDPNFKSRVFEQFMKESISKKNWGQYFTPRNIVDAIIEISDIEKLEPDSKICDPACGVGGFILEPMKVKTNGVNFYYKIDGKTIKPRYSFIGYDKGFDKEEQLTIILAKANMLIFLSELLKTNPTLSEEFSRTFNNTFKLLKDTILGTLSKIEHDKYDLIITNPPYVTSGSSNYKDRIKKDNDLREFYKISAIGVEGLFLEWIIRSLKPSKKAFVIIPDGILNRLNDDKLRQFIRDECTIDAIISLPINAFYTTPKKTYILAITKKDADTDIKRKGIIQTEPVFTYLVSNIGETLDVNRFVIPENDLIEAVSLFNQFKGSKTTFKTNSKRCKIQPIDRFVSDEHWSIDRWWSKDEKVELGVEEKQNILQEKEFYDQVKEMKTQINGIFDEFLKG